MSYIHEALKKAQKERDSRLSKYSGLLSNSGKSRRVFSRRIVFCFWVPLLMISAAFVLYSWVGLDGLRIPKTPKAQDKKPEQAPASAPQAEFRIGGDDLFERGRSFHQKGRLKDAERFYKQVLKVDPNRAEALNNLGVIYMGGKDYSAAQRHFEKAIKVKPDYVDPYYNLACLHAITGETSQSLEQLKKAVTLNKAVRDWARKDNDLKNVWKSPEFEEILRD